jgi:hypothetical protein
MALRFGPSIERDPASIRAFGVGEGDRTARIAYDAARLLEIRRAIRCMGTDIGSAMSSSRKFSALDAEGLDH